MNSLPSGKILFELRWCERAFYIKDFGFSLTRPLSHNRSVLRSSSFVAKASKKWNTFIILLLLVLVLRLLTEISSNSGNPLTSSTSDLVEEAPHRARQTSGESHAPTSSALHLSFKAILSAYPETLVASRCIFSSFRICLNRPRSDKSWIRRASKKVGSTALYSQSFHPNRCGFGSQVWSERCLSGNAGKSDSKPNPMNSEGPWSGFAISKILWSRHGSAGGRVSSLTSIQTHPSNLVGRLLFTAGGVKLPLSDPQFHHLPSPKTILGLNLQSPPKYWYNLDSE